AHDHAPRSATVAERHELEFARKRITSLHLPEFPHLYFRTGVTSIVPFSTTTEIGDRPTNCPMLLLYLRVCRPGESAFDVVQARRNTDKKKSDHVRPPPAGPGAPEGQGGEVGDVLDEARFYQ